MPGEVERRTSKRVDAFVIVQLDKDGRHGVSRDVGERGLLVGTSEPWTVGDELEVTIGGPSTAIRTRARVVRVEETSPEEAWSFRVALELEHPVPREIVEEGARIAAALYGRGSAPPLEP